MTFLGIRQKVVGISDEIPTNVFFPTKRYRRTGSSEFRRNRPIPTNYRRFRPSESPCFLVVDVWIRIPSYLPGFYICLQGDLQASFLYKNVTLATSSPQKYDNLKYREAQVLKVSAGVSGEGIYGLIGKDITEDMKEKKEVRFGTRFYITDCRENTTGTMRYACDEVTLRFEPGSEMKAALFGMNPSCVNY
ncbi:BnaC06g31130D [Brassica napus]|uniref:BnaC06g31130D protein n=1 Tax=Brassica napus TaxID=3708 RepID=A0A078FEE6_BRANA|nr:BnaC06g31130D [Brassica napus]